MSSLTIEPRPAINAGDEFPGQHPRELRWAMLTLDALFLAICLTFILLAPGGQWANRVIGVSLWWNGDPGAGYVVGSLYAFTPSRHEFVGHPGLPIQLVVGAFAHLIYSINRISGGGESFFDFWARNFRGLFILGSCIIALFHVASFHVLFAFAKESPAMRRSPSSPSSLMPHP